ncbi:Holliday junction resolvase RuvX [Bacteroidota bacterium]|nr:Holliday junction resolvase RuvX [Bacteroidota bacterium]MDC3129918.1 Holliday junction resolvase RuvX [Bacteroidota bacterium]MDC3230535.1 Holliday junction resolvase RuvX [Bacteroidota bacterium]
MSKVIGIDYGKKRIGIAISDIDQKIAFPLITVENNKPIEILKKIIEYQKVATIVVGVPINLDGSNTDATEICFKFHLRLKKEFPKINHFVADERLTSKLAKRFLNHSHKKKQRGNKKNVDKISASIILENFLIGLN